MDEDNCSWCFPFFPVCFQCVPYCFRRSPCLFHCSWCSECEPRCTCWMCATTHTHSVYPVCSLLFTVEPSRIYNWHDFCIYSGTPKETGKCGFSRFGQYLGHTASNSFHIKTSNFYYLYILMRYQYQDSRWHSCETVGSSIEVLSKNSQANYSSKTRARTVGLVPIWRPFLEFASRNCVPKLNLDLARGLVPKLCPYVIPASRFWFPPCPDFRDSCVPMTPRCPDFRDSCVPMTPRCPFLLRSLSLICSYFLLDACSQ